MVSVLLLLFIPILPIYPFFDMCTHKRLVTNKYTGRSLYADCGKCPACRQAKADKQASRIRSHVDKNSGFVFLFAHLTYLNECVPYIRKSELLDHPTYAQVYRDYDRRFVQENDNLVLKYFPMSEPLTEVEFIDSDGNPTLSIDSISSAPTLQNSYHKRPTSTDMSDKIGIIYYPDVQNFFKKFKIYLKRNFKFSEKYDYKVHFYSASEYGGEKFRPHFHLLICCRPQDLATFKSAVVKSWSYAYRFVTESRLEQAIDAASYVASYINKSQSFPKIFEEHSIRQRHSFSQGFGCNLRAFSLDKILENARRGDMRYYRSVNIQGIPLVLPFVYPKYVISRYFPKYKGFSRLSNGTIQWLLSDASFVQSDSSEKLRNEIYEKLILCCRNYRDLVYFKEDLHKISVSLVNKIMLSGMSPRDYGIAYTKVWTCYYSTLYRSLLENANVFQQWQCYDNIADYFSGDVSSPSLDDLMLVTPSSFHYETDVNKFYRNVQDTERLEHDYQSKLLQHEVNSAAYVQFNNHV